MSEHVYPTSAMLGDYLRAAAGLLPTAAILATVPVGTVAATVVGGFGVIFAAFGVRTVLRHGTRLEMSEAGVRAAGIRHTAIAWAELDRMRLAYYSTNRDGRDGWMQLELGAGRARLRMDSRIAGFAGLVERAAAAAAARGLALNATTEANLRQFGVRAPAIAAGGAR